MVYSIFVHQAICVSLLKVFSFFSHLAWPNRIRYLLVFAALVWLPMHLTSLMAKNEAKPAFWTPPVEPPGSVVVTSNTFPAEPVAERQSLQVSADLNKATNSSRQLNASPTSKVGAGGSRDDLVAALGRWSDAWRRQDMAAYLGSYVGDFVPKKGVSREAWVRQRTSRITSKQSIRHEIRDLDVEMVQNKAIVKFTQIYADERLQQSDQKLMHWQFKNGKWLISKEVSN
jgi:hypothetical protein